MIRLKYQNDTKNMNFNRKQQKIIDIILEKGEAQSSIVYEEMVKSGEKMSLVTVKRFLSKMVVVGFLRVIGSGRSTVYTISALGRIFANIDSGKYCAIDPDKRYGLRSYNFDLFPALPANIFTSVELKILNNATAEYDRRTKNLPEVLQKKELERLIIELSWKSSKIEGNTYSLLDTEKLILENKEAPGHDKKEALMILNHKEAFHFIHEHKDKFTALTKSNLEEVHMLLVKDMKVGLGLRQAPVGVTGSTYRPLDNIYQIQEAVESLCQVVSKMATPYAKALIALLGISYIQPFEDGNKRTARLVANALLLSYGLAPLSYRSVEEKDFREATLVFYEINSILPLKKIFVEQYEFATKNYAVK